MIKLFIVCAAMVMSLSACDQQASRELGAAPKKIIDKATNDINAAQAAAADKLKAAEEAAAPTEKSK
jgi:hypothetical protein